MTTILLGPQRFVTTVGPAVRALGVDGPVAVINAGWEERESDDAELNGLLGGHAVNLRLHHRMFDVVDKDERFRAAALAFRDRHDELRAFYGIRVQAAMDAVEAVLHRTSTQGLRDSALVAAVESVRDVDRWYAAALKDLYRELDAGAPPDESEAIGWHRGEIDAVLRDCAVVVLPGGHVGTLLRALRLFRIALPADRPVVAWSAGAMVLTDKVVLFHDFAPQGVSAPELYDRGLGRLPGTIVLPHARRRLRLDDHAALSVLARRFPDHRLVLLDDGAQLRFETGGAVAPAHARVLTFEGTIEQVGA
jgi:hypothetical protein